MNAMIFLFLSNLFSAYVPVKGRLPDELSHIVRFIQRGEFYRENKKEIDSLIVNIDSVFLNVKKKDVYFLIRSEIYKTLLENSFHREESLKSIPSGMLEKLERKKKVATSPFFIWLIGAVHTDLKNIFQDSEFVSIQKNLNSPSKLTAGAKLVRKKLLLLIPWYHSLALLGANELESKVYPLLLQCLRAVHFKGRQYALLAKYPIGDGAQLSYFKKGDILPEKNHDGDGKRDASLDALVESVAKKYDQIELPAPVSDWSGRNEDFAKGETPLELPIPRKGYVAPGNLPGPSDDWNLEN